MNVQKVEKNNGICAVIHSDHVIITDVSSALEVLMNANYAAGTKHIVLDKQRIT